MATSALNAYTTRLGADKAVAGAGTRDVFLVDQWTQLDRFLLLGTEAGSYYAKPQKLTKQNAENIQRCINSDGIRTINRIIEVSDQGLATRNDPAIFALMLCTSSSDETVRKAAWEAFPKVCRTFTHVSHAVTFREQFGGWGRAARKGVAQWFNGKTPEQVAFQSVKYPSRDGWAMRDVLRIAHPKPDSDKRNAVYQYIVKGATALDNAENLSLTPGIILAAEYVKGATDRAEVIRYITDNKLPWEAVPNQFLGADNTENAAVWEALLEHMPPGAMLRQLPTLTRVGLLTNGSAATKKIEAALTSHESLRRARLHPLAIVSALRTYQGGHSLKGSSTWTPVRKIVDTLDTAFYEAFAFVEPTNLTHLLAIDVSGSMTWQESFIQGLNLSSRDAAAVMAMAVARTEPNYEIVAFSNGISSLIISPRQRLDDVIATINRMSPSSTDCSLPMTWAVKQSTKFDVFQVYTDSETNYHRTSPAVALRNYRASHNATAKLAVIGMVANNISIADPKDAGMMDFVGADASLPQALAIFARGSVDISVPAEATKVVPTLTDNSLRQRLSRELARR